MIFPSSTKKQRSKKTSWVNLPEILSRDHYPIRSAPPIRVGEIIKSPAFIRKFFR